jgi:hypothetical protein
VLLKKVRKALYFNNMTNKHYFSFLLLQKRNKKRAPKSITSRFREGALIKLLHYCELKFSSLIIDDSKFVSFFNSTTPYLILLIINLCLPDPDFMKSVVLIR